MCVFMPVDFTDSMPKPSPFSPDQESQIVLQYGRLGSIVKLRRWFRLHYNLHPQHVPGRKQFERVIKRFTSTNSTAHGKTTGRPSSARTEDNVERIQQLISDDMTLSIRRISALVLLSIGSVWNILRKNLKLYPYKPHNTVPLTEAHKETRVEFCDWILSQPDGFPNNVFFSDEKIFTEKIRPNKQTERYWCNVDPEIEDENRVQGGRKVMAWAGLINGKVVIHWFLEGERINQHNYLDMLKTVMWPAVSHVATRRQYWFQQDGARPHTTGTVLQWLEEKFGTRVISNLTDRVWPAKSPDLSLLDYWFWGVCLAELRRSPPASPEELMETVNEFAASLSPEEIRKAVNDILPRASACIAANGGAFEYKLRKHKRDIEE